MILHLTARDQRRFWSKIENRGRPLADAPGCHKWKGTMWDGKALFWLHGGTKYVAAHRLLFCLRLQGKTSIADIDGPLDVEIPHGGRTNFFCLTDGCMNPEHFHIDWDPPSGLGRMPSEADIKAASAYFERMFKDRLCPSCNRKWEGKQKGRCVYCEHCGARLYQGGL